jgi:hypothetical protein
MINAYQLVCFILPNLQFPFAGLSFEALSLRANHQGDG